MDQNNQDAAEQQNQTAGNDQVETSAETGAAAEPSGKVNPNIKLDMGGMPHHRHIGAEEAAAAVEKAKQEPPLNLEGVKFTAQDLFVLMKGMDTDQFICNSHTLDFDEISENLKRGDWWKDVVAKYEPLGLVDADGWPTKAFFRALSPMTHPNICVSKVEEPDDPQDDPRQVEVYLYQGIATAVRRVNSNNLADDSEFELIPFPNFSDGTNGDEWESKFRELFGIAQSFKYADIDDTAVFAEEGGDSYVGALLASDVDFLRVFSKKHGVSLEGLEKVAKVLSNDDADVVAIITRDYTNCTFAEESGYTIAKPERGAIRDKITTLVCEAGFESVSERNRQKDMPSDYWRDPELAAKAQFERVSFIKEGSLFDRLCTVDPYPED